MKKSIVLIILSIFIMAGWPRAGAVTNDFYFVQVTDTHFGPDKHIKSLRKIVTYINHLPMKIEFVAVTGDLTSENIEDPEVMQAGLDELKRLQVPLHVLPGNHDIRPQKKDIMYKLYKKYFGKAYYTVQYHGVSCIFWYDEPWHGGGLDITGYEPLAWLEQSLQQAGQEPVLLFLHSPPTTDFYQNSFHDSWPPQKLAPFRELISRYPVQGIFAGHFHRAEQHWLGSVPVYVAPSVAAYWKRQASYRIWHYQDGRLSYMTQYIE